MKTIIRNNSRGSCLLFAPIISEHVQGFNSVGTSEKESGHVKKPVETGKRERTARSVFSSPDPSVPLSPRGLRTSSWCQALLTKRKRKNWQREYSLAFLSACLFIPTN